MDIESTDNPIDVRIYTVRGERVMLDDDLAEIYGVATATLNQAVGRHSKRFPASHAFWLTSAEYRTVRPYVECPESLPRVFTQSGAVGLAFVLQSAEAVAANIWIVNAIVGQHGGEPEGILSTLFFEAFLEDGDDSQSDAVFHFLPTLVAIDRHKRTSKRRRH